VAIRSVYCGDRPPWDIAYDVPDLPNFLFWLRWRSADAPPCPEAAWLEWLDEVMAFGLPGRWASDQATLIRYPALAELAEREWPAFYREWNAETGLRLGRRLIRSLSDVPAHQPDPEDELAGSALQLRFLLVDHADDLVRQVGPNTWLLGEAYLDPQHRRELLARLRRELED
jgi:hypothetical protein